MLERPLSNSLSINAQNNIESGFELTFDCPLGSAAWALIYHFLFVTGMSSYVRHSFSSFILRHQLRIRK